MITAFPTLILNGGSVLNVKLRHVCIILLELLFVNFKIEVNPNVNSRQTR
ncbi:hypothetical protein NC99_08430 [Sunxiuqinia dokdonensis]|uniref:Uncharacterized protein n=1 Tax=Sunxiuqinia dokdonensis TaxID=1409788 RepID=A0A0L8VCX6_9BACT|nr:hypothetical protein NC99_08430 [Sunxiuqinia dokdonensis]